MDWARFERRTWQVRNSRRSAIVKLIFGLLAIQSCALGQAQTRPASNLPPLQAIRITSLEIRYRSEPPPGLPDLAVARERLVELGKLADVYVGKDESPQEVVKLKIGQIGQAGDTLFDLHAIQAICQTVTQVVNDSGIYAVYTEPDPGELSPDGAQDLRTGGKTSLTLFVWVGKVTRVRTIASGDRVPEAQRIDNELHLHIVDYSPIKQSSVASHGEDLIRKDQLDDYAIRLNRYPGRHVDAALTAGENDGEVWLDYLVSEAKPWFVLAQVSNTGTKDTSEWRERFAGILYQMFNRDDIFAIDYTTAGFQYSHNVNVTYEGNIIQSGKLRWKATGNYNQFTASDLAIQGLPNAATPVDGSSYGATAEVIPNLAQWHEVFLDGFGGVSLRNFETSPSSLINGGNATYYGVYGGLRLQRLTDTSSTDAEVRIAYETTSADEVNISSLGQTGADSSWTLVQAQVSHSFYLDPIFFRGKFRDEKSSANLVNELAFSGRLQSSLGAVLVPQATEIIGGFYTVRGYDESVASGDSGAYGTAEYRFHLAHFLNPAGPNSSPTFMYRLMSQPWLYGPEFRDRPDRLKYGHTDWDLIFRAFVDAGHVTSETVGRPDQTLVGTGVGAELQIKQNFSIRTDLGFALTDKEVTDGGSRLHVVATLSY
jgi:hemolysin activation/secretion protein